MYKRQGKNLSTIDKKASGVKIYKLDMSEVKCVSHTGHIGQGLGLAVHSDYKGLNFCCWSHLNQRPPSFLNNRLLTADVNQSSSSQSRIV